MEDWRLSRVGDAAITIEFELRIDPAINARVLAVADALRRSDHGGVRDVVESCCAVTVEYNPLRTDVQRVIRDLEAAAGRERGERGGRPRAHGPGVLRRRFRSGPCDGRCVRRMQRSSGDRDTWGSGLSCLHAGIPAGLRLYGSGG